MLLLKSVGDCWLWLSNLFINRSITIEIKDVGHRFHLNKAIMKLIVVFSNKSFDERE